MKIATLIFALFLVGCTTPKMVYRPVAVPAGLTEAVSYPLPPNPQTATQRDVALYLIALHEALDMANTRLAAIRNWSARWTK